MDHETQQPAFDQFAIIELFGHQSIAGRLREEQRFGTTMARVDVPAVGVNPAYTRYIGGSALYRVTPCTEEAAKAYVEQRVYEPPVPYDVRRQLTSAPSEAGELPAVEAARRSTYDAVDTSDWNEEF